MNVMTALVLAALIGLATAWVKSDEISKLLDTFQKMVLELVKLPKGEMFISTNELHLSLVIESLFDNTNKFTDSGSVTLKIKLDKAQSKLRIEVTDTGCGIPPEEREEIFLCLSV